MNKWTAVQIILYWSRGSINFYNIYCQPRQLWAVWEDVNEYKRIIYPEESIKLKKLISRVDAM